MIALSVWQPSVCLGSKVQMTLRDITITLVVMLCTAETHLYSYVISDDMVAT